MVPVEGQASRLFQKPAQMALIFRRWAQIDYRHVDGVHLRHQRDLRDPRRLLEDAMMPEVHRPKGSRFLPDVADAPQGGLAFDSLGMTAAIGNSDSVY